MGDLSTETNMMQRFRERGLKWVLAPGALVILYLFFGFFGINYFSYPTLVNIIDAAYYIGFISMGVTFVIISGGIDLSVGTVMMAAAITGGTALKHGFPMVPSLILIIVVGLAFGAFNGIMVSRLKMPPFIVTLGTMMISMGVGSIISNVSSATFPIRGQPGGWFKDIFLYLGASGGGAIPTGALLLAAIAVICHIMLSNTKLGRYTYAIGSNLEAARLSGVDVKKWQLLVYVIAGGTAGIGGISYAAIYTTVLPAQGQGFELYAIAARGHRGHVACGRNRDHLGNHHRRFHHVGAGHGPSLLEPRGSLADVLHGRHRHRGSAPGYVPDQEGGGSPDRNARGHVQGVHGGKDRRLEARGFPPEGCRKNGGERVNRDPDRSGSKGIESNVLQDESRRESGAGPNSRGGEGR